MKPVLFLLLLLPSLALAQGSWGFGEVVSGQRGVEGLNPVPTPGVEPEPAAGAVSEPMTEVATPQPNPDAPDPEGTFSFGGMDYNRAAEIIAPGAGEVSPVVENVPVKIVSPVEVVSAVATVSSTVQPRPVGTSLSFWADDLTLSAAAKKQLAGFVKLAKPMAPLKSLKLTQRVVGPLNALEMLAGARRQAVLEELKKSQVIGLKTKVLEVRVRGTAASSKMTLVGE